MEVQQWIKSQLIDLDAKRKVQTVATADVHYLMHEDAYDALPCTQSGDSLKNPT